MFPACGDETNHHALLQFWFALLVELGPKTIVGVVHCAFRFWRRDGEGR
jgi:hypothetical protein